MKSEMRKCSMCGEYMQIDNFRFMRSQNRHNSYCRECERWYQKHYHRTYRARKKRGEQEMQETLLILIVLLLLVSGFFLLDELEERYKEDEKDDRK